MKRTERYVETVDADVFEQLRSKRRWSYEMPLRKRYEKYIPPQAFAVAEDICLIVEGPRIIRFRKRWSFRFIDMNIRLIYIVNDGRSDPYYKVHLV